MLLFHRSEMRGEQDLNFLKISVIAKVNDRFLGKGH